MADYPRLDPNGLLYYTQQLKTELEGEIAEATPVMTGAGETTDGDKGLVPKPNAGQNEKFLRGDGVWADPIGTENTIETISVNGTNVPPDASKNVDITIPNVPVTGVKVNNVAVTPDSDGNVNIPVPTKTSDITNDSDFQTGDEVASAIADALDDITGIDFEIVTELPSTGEKGVFYLIANSGESSNIYDEYIWVKTGGTAEAPVYGFEKIGTTAVDLSGYVQRTDMTTISNATIDSIISTAFGV